MPHVIKASTISWYLSLEINKSEYLVGQKEFRISTEGNLLPLYSRVPYNIEGINNLGIVYTSPTTEQPVILYIPTFLERVEDGEKVIVSYHSEKEIFLNLGMHVLPLLQPKVSIFDSGDKLIASNIVKYEENGKICYEALSRIIVPVMFKVKDIKFYDGLYISVQRFILPSKDMTKKILEYIEKFLNDDIDRKCAMEYIIKEEAIKSEEKVKSDRWLQIYENFYNHLIK